MAQSDWARVPLGQVLTQVFDEVRVEDGVTYKQVTVRMHNKGLTLRQEIGGQEIKTKRQFRVREGQFVFSRIDARNGAMGIVPRELDGAIVSNDFPVFAIHTNQVDRDFFKYCVSTAPFLDACLAQSKGTSNRRRLKEPHFLEIEILLPPLAEQQRIVARIDALAARIAEAQELQAEAVEEAEAFLDSTSAKTFQDLVRRFLPVRIADADLEMNRESRNPTKASGGEFSYVDISSVGQGPSILNTAKVMPTNDAPSRARRVIHKDDIIFSTVRPNLRTVALIGESLDNQICSTGFAVFSCGESINSKFLMHQICSPFFIDQCVAFATGGHYPAINDTSLREVKIVVPPLDEQRRAVAHLDRVQARVDALKQLQEKSQEELDALLPSVLDKAFRGEL